MLWIFFLEILIRCERHDEHKTHVFVRILQTLVVTVLVLVFVRPRTRTAPFDAANVPTSCTAK